MKYKLKNLYIDNFKSYSEKQKVQISDFSLLVGANSSGKSTALQTLLVLKQTIECNNADIHLLLSGKYVTLGNFDDVINDNIRGKKFKIGIDLIPESEDENNPKSSLKKIVWEFEKDEVLHGNVKLRSIEIQMSDTKITLIHKEKNWFAIKNGNTLTLREILVENLKTSNISILFDKEFNELFCDFYADIFDFFYGKKSYMLDKTNLACFEGWEIISKKVMDSKNKEYDLDNGIKKEQLVQLFDLIEKYSCKQILDFSVYSGYKLVLPFKFIISQLESTKKDSNVLEKIIQKYSSKLEEYKDANKTERFNISNYIVSHKPQILQKKADETENINFSLNFYEEVLEGLVEQLFYIGPLRDKPQGLYNIGFESNPKYVGPTGAYFPSVLLSESSKKRSYVLPESEIDVLNLSEALNEWALHLNIASNISVTQNNSFGFSVSVTNTERKKSDIMNVGVGTSQVLPVLILGLLSKKDDILLFEQPELHLHPYSQSRLADFFIELAKNDRKIIIETHSEYLINRIRYNVLKDVIDFEKIRLNFFKNSEYTKVSYGNISGYGDISYPDDFMDQTQIQINEILNAIVKKGRQEDAK